MTPGGRWSERGGGNGVYSIVFGLSDNSDDRVVLGFRGYTVRLTLAISSGDRGVDHFHCVTFGRDSSLLILWSVG